MALTTSQDADFYPYRLTQSLLTASEKGFYVALLMAAGGRYVVFPKVGLADLCQDLDRWADTAAFNQVSSKHVDFVLCDAKTFRPVLAVELNDRSHLGADRRARDALVTASSARWGSACTGSGCAVRTIRPPSREESRTP